MSVRVREGEVAIERFDAVTAANYCCSIFHTVCLISGPVERDRDSRFLFLPNSRALHTGSRVTGRRKQTHALITESLQEMRYL